MCLSCQYNRFYKCKKCEMGRCGEEIDGNEGYCDQCLYKEECIRPKPRNCKICGTFFESGNALFRHLRANPHHMWRVAAAMPLAATRPSDPPPPPTQRVNSSDDRHARPAARSVARSVAPAWPATWSAVHMTLPACRCFPPQSTLSQTRETLLPAHRPPPSRSLTSTPVLHARSLQLKAAPAAPRPPWR